MTEFRRSAEDFPVKKHYIYLNHCGISAMYAGAMRAANRFNELQAEFGIGLFKEYGDILGRLRGSVGQFLNTPGDNIAFVKNTAEGLGLVAGGYPFEEGDEIISYDAEYPSNHYPWLLQERRGARLILLKDADPIGSLGDVTAPRGFSMDDLLAAITERTRIIALSHVQFTSGFALNLEGIAELCRERGIHLVIDAAQSLGSLPIDLTRTPVDCVAASGWKWLLGPVGTGLLYTSPEFRAKLRVPMSGAEQMTQGDDYLDHTWSPHTSARVFEYSTATLAAAVALQSCFDDIMNVHGVHNIHSEILRLQDLLLSGLDLDRFRLLKWPEEHRSGILAFQVDSDPGTLAKRALDRGVFCSARGGYLRLAPHVSNTDEEMERAATILNGIT